jgi:branched-chain amino acid transport system substrate-binding protein
MKRVNLIRLFVVTMIALLIVGPGLLFVSGCAKEEAALAPIKIGLINTYTGSSTAWTIPDRTMWTLSVNDINQAGGILGRKVELIVRDDKGKVDINLRNCKELTTSENVNFLVGGILSSSALATSQYAKENKILYFCDSAASSAITGANGHRYVFNAGMISSLQCPALAKVAAQRPYMKYWIIGEDYAYGHAMANDFWNAMTALKPGVQKIGETWVKMGEVDYSAQIANIVAAKPDAVYACEGALGIIPFIKQAKLHGLDQQVPIIMIHATDYATCGALGQDMVPGILSASGHLITYPDTPENQNFVKTYFDKAGDYPTDSVLNAYCVANFLTQAIKKAGTVETEAVIDALKGSTIPTPVGPQTIRAYDQQVMTPTFVSVTNNDPKYPFFTAKDVVTVPAEEVAPSVDAIKKLRGE